MKKLVIAALFLVPSVAKADVIQTTLLDHVTTVTQFKSGETKLALLDSIIRVGKYNDKSIFDVQAGFSGETAPDSTEPTGANLLIGGLLKASTFASGLAKFPEHWEFLNSLEYGPYIQYDFREDVWVGGFQAGLAFSLQPVQ